MRPWSFHLGPLKALRKAFHGWIRSTKGSQDGIPGYSKGFFASQKALKRSLTNKRQQIHPTDMDLNGRTRVSLKKILMRPWSFHLGPLKALRKAFRGWIRVDLNGRARVSLKKILMTPWPFHLGPLRALGTAFQDIPRVLLHPKRL